MNPQQKKRKPKKNDQQHVESETGCSLLQLPFTFESLGALHESAARAQRLERLLNGCTGGAGSTIEAISRMTDLKNDVHSTLTFMDARLKQLSAELVEASEEVVQSVTAADEWYLHWDMSLLSYDEVDAILTRTIVHDAKKWSNNFRCIFKSLRARACSHWDQIKIACALGDCCRACPSQRFIDPLAPCQCSTKVPECFARTLVRMLMPLQNVPDGARHAFHLLVFIMVQNWSFIEPGFWFDTNYFKGLLKGIMADGRLQRLVPDFCATVEPVVCIPQQNGPTVDLLPPPPPPHGFATPHATHGTAETPGVMGKVWVDSRDCAEASKSWPSPTNQFWDFATAYREVWSEFQTWECQCSAEDCDDFKRQRRCSHVYRADDPQCQGTCFRKNSLGLLETMQRRAVAEVKAKVRFVVGSRLPTELFDEVVTWALRAEELPDDPEIWEAERRGKPDLWSHNGKGWPDFGLGTWRLKERYRCATYDKPDDESETTAGPVNA